MADHQSFRLRNPCLFAALAAAYPLVSFGAGAGSVDFASPGVTAVDASGVARPLRKGAEISQGDTVRTGEGGRAQVRFSDGAMVSLQPQTDFRIDNYKYAGKSDGTDSGFFSLLKGGMRTITGLIGRGNRDAYKLQTNVATIGIRGTEYSGSLNPGTGELVVNTGEGLIEVCNGAGCMLLASGESGIVSGSNSLPRRTDSRPQLSPAQPTGSTLVTFSSSENRSPDGLVAPVSPPLPSGSGYTIAWSGLVTGSPYKDVSTGSADFGSASDLRRFTSSDTFTMEASAGSFTADGVIAWGRWSKGGYYSPGDLENFHYVVGMHTSSSDMTALGGLKAEYALAGFTRPTSTGGIVGGSPSGSFSADFAMASVKLNLNVPINGGVVTLLNESGTISGSTFSGSSFGGFFAGANASHAGMGYKIPGGAVVSGDVMGVLVFKQTSTSSSCSCC